MMRKVRAEGENRLKRLVNNVKRSTVWKLMFTVIVIFIGMTLLSNFITNIYVNDLIQDMDKEISKMVDASDESEMYLIINDSQIKSNMEFKIYIFCVVLFTVIIGCIVLYLVISKIMRPLNNLTLQVADIDINNIEDLNREIVATKGGYEIEKLACAFNESLEKMHHDYESQKKFSMNLAHEVRTPLAVLHSKIDVFNKKEDRTAEEYDKLIESLKFNIERLSDLVNKLLFITKKRSGIELKEICINDIVDEVNLDLEGKAEAKNIVISQDGERVTMYTNDALMERILFNLVENAIKYNRIGGTVNISVKSENDKVCMKIADTGIGISDDDKSKVFDLFYRVNENSSEGNFSYGLGLPLVESLVKILGGKIFIRDNEPEGSIFVLEFKNLAN